MATRRSLGQRMLWLPWLGLALLIALALSPGVVTASQLVFQSPPPATDTPLPPTPVPQEPPPPTNTPIPAEPPAPTEAPLPAEPAPAEPVPAEPVPPEAPTPAEAPPGEPQPAPQEPLPPTATTAPLPMPEATTPVEMPETPAEPVPAEEPTPPPSVEADQPVVNMVKFWDTVTIILAYPWLCCGILLFLLVPITLLALEIKGRQPPPRPPEMFRPEETHNEE